MQTIYHTAVLSCAILSAGQVGALLRAEQPLQSMPGSDGSGTPIAWQMNYDEAARLSAQTQTPMLVQVSASWCAYCVKMSRETFQDESIVAHVNLCFIPIKIDADSHPEFARLFGANTLPTTLIVSPDLKIAQRLSGYQSPGQLQTHLRQYCRSNSGSHCSSVAAREPRNPVSSASESCSHCTVPTSFDCMVDRSRGHAAVVR